MAVAENMHSNRVLNLGSAIEYARGRLASEIPSSMPYHGLAHTERDVVPVVERLAATLGIAGRPLELLRTAAWFHDIGYIEQYGKNEGIAVRIARGVLPALGYGDDDLDTIETIIDATRLPQRPRGLLAEIMADADLYVLCSAYFLDRNHALRAEFEAQGITYDDVTWWRDQLRFVQNHRYFTTAALAEAALGKATNIEALQRRLLVAEARAR